MNPTADPNRLQATVEKLASFNTRNTLSPTLKDACQWLVDEYNKIDGIEAELMTYTAPKGRRVPEEMQVVQVVATLKGKSDRVILVGGHIDSLNLSVDPVTGRAPGANDDASGVALALECARMLAAEGQPECTIKFVGFSGEEQGLLGATALAQKATDEKWKLEAVLNNDTVGSSRNLNDQSDSKRVRVFSEEGEDHESRELARFIEWQIRQQMKDFAIKLVFRRDRFGRGGDHTPFVQAGFSGVRFIEVHEEYTRQHTPDDLPEHMDWNYLQRVTQANYHVLKALGNSQVSPTRVRISRQQGHNTTVDWNGNEDGKYMVYWRETTSPTWQHHMMVDRKTEASIEKVNKDDHIFAVGSLGGIPVEAR